MTSTPDRPADLSTALEASFGEGPAHRTPADRVALGRRALRRRRATGAVAGVGAIAVVVGAVWGVSAALGGPSNDTGPVLAPAAVPTRAVASTVSPPDRRAEREAARKAEQRAEREAQKLVSDQFPASLDGNGELVVKDGWKVTRRVPNPAASTAPEASLGVVMTKQGEPTRWMLLTLDYGVDENGDPLPSDDLNASASADDAGGAYAEFDDWLADMVALNGGPAVDPLVVVKPNGTILPGPDATIVEVQPAPVIERYTETGDKLAKVERDGRTWFAVVRIASAGDVVPVDAAVLPEPTFSALITHLRAKTASGEGVR